MNASSDVRCKTVFTIFESSPENEARVLECITSLDSDKKISACQWTLQIIDFERKISNPDKFFWVTESIGGKIVSVTPIAAKSHLGIFYKIYLATNYYGFYVDVMLPINFSEFIDFLNKRFRWCLAISLAPLHPDRMRTITASNKVDLSSSTVISKNYFVRIDNFEEYWRSRPSKLKNTVLRKSKKLNSLNAVYRITDHPTDTDIEDYWEVYNKSWKKNEPNRDFITWVLNNYSERHSVYLGFVYIDNSPVASQIWLKENNEYYIFKLAQICEFDNFSPGTLLTHYLLKSFSTNKEIVVNFLFGLESYKEMWMDLVTDVYDTTVYKNNFTKKIVDLKKKYMTKGVTS